MHQENTIQQNITVSSFKNYKSTTPQDVNLWEWLKDDSLQAEIEYLRGLESKEERRNVKSTLPCITPSGTFLIRQEAGLREHSGLICIDIDGQDNPQINDFEYLRDQIKNINNVAYCGLSASGKGLFCLIPIKDTDKHKKHFEALKLCFEHFGIKIDGGCGDVSRLRGYSYDPKAYFNMNAVIYNQLLERDIKTTVTTYTAKRKSNNFGELNTRTKVDEIISKILETGIDITGAYTQWFQVGCALADEFGEEGREMYQAVSQFGHNYKVHETDNQFNKCLESSNGYSIGTFFHWASEEGLI
ncbi:MAG: BT4734/BF3469 family protein [Mucilaginibacter sp.]